MDFYSDFNIGTSFKYGYNHIKDGVKKLSQSSEKLKAIGEICFGALECLPLVGIVPALVEKKSANWTTEKLLSNREQFIQGQIESDSFALQEMYFDIYSSNVPGRTLGLKLQAVLDNSTPDRQFSSLIRDLKKFSLGISGTPSDHSKINDSIRLLEEAKPTALLVSEIITSKSIVKKKRLQKDLKDLIKQRVTNLKEGEALLIPSGYMNGNIHDFNGLKNGNVEGHSILIKLEKKNGLFQATVYNTGEGIEYHEKDKEHYDRIFPLHYENISENVLISQSFLAGLTGFAINERIFSKKKNRSADIYNVLNAHFGNPRKISEKDRSYHSQGRVNNCTKKCLQVWLHDELKEAPVYNKFRIFRLNQKVAKVEGILKKDKKIRYSHPLAKWGFTPTLNPLFSAFGGLRGFFGGSTLKLNISKKELENLKDYSKKVLSSREGKLLSKRGVGLKEDNWDFEPLGL